MITQAIAPKVTSTVQEAGKFVMKSAYQYLRRDGANIEKYAPEIPASTYQFSNPFALTHVTFDMHRLGQNIDFRF